MRDAKFYYHKESTNNLSPIGPYYIMVIGARNSTLLPGLFSH